MERWTMAEFLICCCTFTSCQLHVMLTKKPKGFKNRFRFKPSQNKSICNLNDTWHSGALWILRGLMGRQTWLINKVAGGVNKSDVKLWIVANRQTVPEASSVFEAHVHLCSGKKKKKVLMGLIHFPTHSHAMIIQTALPGPHRPRVSSTDKWFLRNLWIWRTPGWAESREHFGSDGSLIVSCLEDVKQSLAHLIPNINRKPRLYVCMTGGVKRFLWAGWIPGSRDPWLSAQLPLNLVLLRNTSKS